MSRKSKRPRISAPDARIRSLPSVLWQQTAEYAQLPEIKNLRETSKLLQVAAERAEVNYRRKCQEAFAGGQCAARVLGGLECSDYCATRGRCAGWVEDFLQSLEAIERASVFSKTADARQTFAVIGAQFDVGGTTFILQRAVLHHGHTVTYWTVIGFQSTRILWMLGSEHVRLELFELVCDAVEKDSSLRLQIELDAPKGRTLQSLQLVSDPAPLVLDVEGNRVEALSRVPWQVRSDVGLAAEISYRPRRPS